MLQQQPSFYLDLRPHQQEGTRVVLESYLITKCSASMELGGEPTTTKTPQTLTALNICLYADRNSPHPHQGNFSLP